MHRFLRLSAHVVVVRRRHILHEVEQRAPENGHPRPPEMLAALQPYQPASEFTLRRTVSAHPALELRKRRIPAVRAHELAHVHPLLDRREQQFVAREHRRIDAARHRSQLRARRLRIARMSIGHRVERPRPCARRAAVVEQTHRLQLLQPKTRQIHIDLATRNQRVERVGVADLIERLAQRQPRTLRDDRTHQLARRLAHRRSVDAQEIQEKLRVLQEPALDSSGVQTR